MPYDGEVVPAARLYMLSYRDRAGLAPTTDFELIAERTRDDRHIRLRQLYRGLPVWGADVVVHATPAAIYAASGNLATKLGQIDLRTQLDAAGALTVAKRAYAQRAKPGTSRLDFVREGSELIIYPRSHGARLA